MGEQAPSRRVEALNVARRLEREFYRDLAGVIQRWERGLTGLEEDQRRRVVLVEQESGLLRVIRDARIAVKRYERRQRGRLALPGKGRAPKKNEQGVS